MNAGESNSLGQLVGSAPQQAGRANAVEGVADARLASHTGAARPCGQPPKSQCTVVGRGAHLLTHWTEGQWTPMGTPL